MESFISLRIACYNFRFLYKSFWSLKSYVKILINLSIDINLALQTCSSVHATPKPIEP